MFTLAEIAAVFAPLLAYLAGNWMNLLAKFAPPAMILVLLLVEHWTGNVWTEFATLLLVGNVVVTTLDVAGYFPKPAPTTPAA